MKKLIASASLVTLGAAGAHAVYAPNLSTMETSKPWSIGATLRGFYDDNYNNAPSNPSPGVPKAQSSGGIEIAPFGRLNFPMEQTYLGVGLNYSMKYFFDRPKNDIDHLVELTIKADHRLSERYKLNFDDSFVYTVEPEIIDSSGPVTGFQRIDADAVRNRATFGFKGQMTELLGVEASYKNNYYHYLAAENIGSLPALLNRFEHYFDVRGTYQIQEHLTGFLGYQYSVYDYTSQQLLGVPTLADPFPATGNSRDNNSHYFYAGAEHAFTSQLNGSAQVGVQYTSYDHLHSSEWNPYVDVRGTYTYLPGSYVQLGFTHTRNATDRAGNGSFQDLTRDQESSTLLASLNHRITPAITGSVIGQYQHSTFNGGSLDGKSENYILLGLNLSYQINVNWAAEIGYNLDDLDSDVQDRGFTRNRVYGGVRANF